MHRITFAIILGVGLFLPTASVWAGSQGRRKAPPPLAKLEKGRIVLKKPIEFASWRVRKTSYPGLRAVANILRKHRKMTVRIEVHSDSRGSARFNQASTQRRAEEIKAHLVKMKTKAHRWVAVGRGEAYPIASNRTAEGRAKNRRIEFRVIPRKRRGRRRR